MKKIISCKGQEYQHLDNQFNKELLNIIVDAEVIDFKKDYSHLNSNHKNAGAYSFVISEISDMNKVSKGYCNCTGLVASGISNITGKEISFISHQEPSNILGIYMIPFRLSLELSLNQLMQECIPGSIDIVYLGGEIKNNPKIYEQMTLYINNLVYDIIDLKPAIISEPKSGDYQQDSVVYDTKNRRLYISSR